MLPISILLGIAVSISGWLVVHHLAGNRDRKNRERELRIEVLSEAYLALVRTGIDGSLIYKDAKGLIVNNSKNAEDAIAMIHLYGTEAMSVKASEYSRDISKGNADCTILVNEIRKFIRNELGFSDLESEPNYLSVKV